MAHPAVRRLSVAAATSVAALTAVIPATALAAPHPTPAGTSGGGACLSVSSSEVQRALRVIGPPLGRRDLHWILRSKSTARTPNCPPLMWAAFDTSRGTVSSPTAVLLFRPGKFLGPTTRKTAGYVQVTGSTPFSVTVTYRWPKPQDANANPTGGPVSSTFVALGDSVFRFGELPPGIY